MRLFRRVLLVLIVLLPLVTLVHRNDLGRWDVQRSAMAGPDEFSYLLMADQFLHGGGVSLKQSLGRDTFYPPGFPLLLAGWGKFFGLTAFTAHAFNAVVLCVDTLLAYFLARLIIAMLAGTNDHRRFAVPDAAQAWLALLIAGLFATNWHVLECSLLIMSEPSFMLATFAWLALALRWNDWHVSIPKTAAIVALAITAWAIRGAGIVCVAATLLYPCIHLLSACCERWKSHVPMSPWRRIGPLLLIVALALAYQVTLTRLSPEKSVAAGEESANSYPRQLLHGLTDGNRLSFVRVSDYPALGFNIGGLLLHHFNDYASTFVPWPRENPDMHFRAIAGKCFGCLGMLGFLWHMTARTNAPAPMRFLQLFVLLYFALYLLWPFHFARFWSPVLPVMLIFAADALIRFHQRRPTFSPFAPAALLLALLLMLSIQEVAFKLDNYARRLNYVSDALRDATRTILRRSPDPRHTTVLVMNGDDHFALAWYFSQEASARGARTDSMSWGAYLPQSPQPHVAPKGGKGETPEELLLRNLQSALASDESAQLYFFSYFAHVDAADILANVRRIARDVMDRVEVKKIYQKEIVAAVWEMRIRPVIAPSPKP